MYIWFPFSKEVLFFTDAGTSLVLLGVNQALQKQHLGLRNNIWVQKQHLGPSGPLRRDDLVKQDPDSST